VRVGAGRSDMSRALSKRTGLKSGTLYPLLMRLSDRGLLEADWQEPAQVGRPPRHVYRLTPDGLAVAREMAVDPRAARIPELAKARA